jgi:hypothetical protein
MWLDHQQLAHPIMNGEQLLHDDANIDQYIHHQQYVARMQIFIDTIGARKKFVLQLSGHFISFKGLDDNYIV